MEMPLDELLERSDETANLDAKGRRLLDTFHRIQEGGDGGASDPHDHPIDPSLPDDVEQLQSILDELRWRNSRIAIGWLVYKRNSDLPITELRKLILDETIRSIENHIEWVNRNDGGVAGRSPTRSVTMFVEDYIDLQRYRLEAEGLRLIAKHIHDVQTYMGQIINRLTTAARIHDQSKYSPQEIGLVIKKAQLDELPYMGEAYKEALTNVQDGLEHHYQLNTHHPEFWTNGIEDMSMIHLLELLADWKAASDAAVGGSLADSIEKNTERFNLSPDMVRLLTITARDLGWI